MKIFATILWVVLANQLWAQRIISLAPSITESVCVLDLCDRLVGITDHCNFPPEVLKKTKIGGYLQPNIEKILSLEPDLVFVLPEHRDVAQRLSDLGLKVKTLKNYSLEDIRTTLLAIGELTNRKAAATKKVQAILEQQTLLARQWPQAPRCLMVLGHGSSPLAINEVYAVGKKGYLNEILELAGGDNVVPSQQPYFPKLNREALIALNPDVIIELIPEAAFSQKQRNQRLAAWQTLDHLKAVKNGRVYLLAEEHVLQAGPRYTRTLAQLVDFLEKP